MKTQTTSNQMYCPAAAVRYARVLYELKISEEAIRETEEIFSAVQELWQVFMNPAVTDAKKMRVIDRVFPAEMRNFLKVVCRYQRMNIILYIFAAYRKYCDEQNQILKAVLTCVEPPSEDQMRDMKAFLCRKYKASEVRIEVLKDSGLLGGFVLRAGSDEYDWSLKGRLKRLEQKLTWR